MHDLLRLAGPDLDRLREIELVLTAAAQKKFIHRRQDDGMDGHLLAKRRFGDQGAHALGRMTVEIAGAVRRFVKVRAEVLFSACPVRSYQGHSR